MLPGEAVPIGTWPRCGRRRNPDGGRSFRSPPGIWAGGWELPSLAEGKSGFRHAARKNPWAGAEYGWPSNRPAASGGLCARPLPERPAVLLGCSSRGRQSPLHRRVESALWPPVGQHPGGSRWRTADRTVRRRPTRLLSSGPQRCRQALRPGSPAWLAARWPSGATIPRARIPREVSSPSIRGATR